jgi:hypothetical protein
VGHVVHSRASGREISMHYFSCLCRPGVVSIKSTSVHITSKLCLHPVGSTGHVVHSRACGA